jgi:hypothetical protein
MIEREDDGPRFVPIAYQAGIDRLPRTSLINPSPMTGAGRFKGGDDCDRGLNRPQLRYINRYGVNR